MDITPLIDENKHIITGYGPGMFRINETEHHQSIIVTADSITACPFNTVEALNTKQLTSLIEAIPNTEILLLGTGQKHISISPKLYVEAQNKGVAIEAMDTAAACRTYNVLLSEERSVTACLISI